MLSFVTTKQQVDMCFSRREVGIWMSKWCVVVISVDLNPSVHTEVVGSYVDL